MGMHSFSSLYNDNAVISKEYAGPLDFDITGVDCIHISVIIYCGDDLVSNTRCLIINNNQ